MTTTTTLEIEQYYERVRAALAGLPTQARDDLLEDLPDHLVEVSAEGDGSLEDRLGQPETYADELRAAAGLEPGELPGPVPTGFGSSVAGALRRLGEYADRFDVQAAKLVGYPRLTDLLRATRPGWWVLRGWVLAQFFCGTHDRASWHGFIPSIGGNWVVGLLLTVLAIAASVWVGRQSLRFAVWGRRVMAVASVLIAAWGILVLAANIGGTAYAYSQPGYQNYSSPYDNVSDLYVYDKNGKLVDGARLYDQNGNSLQLGSGACADGSPPSGAQSDSWTYPLCPTDLGPFRAGPGPVTASPNTATGSAPSDSASTSAPAPSATPTGKPSAKPTAKPTR